MAEKTEKRKEEEKKRKKKKPPVSNIEPAEELVRGPEGKEPFRI
jgi:hypothetical protein